MLASAFLFTRILAFVGFVPERWIIYETQQSNFSLQDINLKDNDNIRILKDNINGGIEGSLLEMLSIVAIFGTVLAFIFNVIIRKEYDDRYKKLERETRSFTEAHSLKVSGVTAYYRFLLYRDCAIRNKKTPNTILDIIDKALYDTSTGIEIIQEINGVDTKNELLDCILKNNFAWINLEKWIFVNNEENKISEDKRKDAIRECICNGPIILKYSKHAYKQGYKHGGVHLISWTDTYDRILSEYPHRKNDRILHNSSSCD